MIITEYRVFRRTAVGGGSMIGWRAEARTREEKLHAAGAYALPFYGVGDTPASALRHLKQIGCQWCVEEAVARPELSKQLCELAVELAGAVF